MPIIPNYQVSFDDMTAMDNLTYNKTKILDTINKNKSKIDSEDTNKYLIDTITKNIDYSSPSAINDTFKSNIKDLLNSNINLLSQINNRILRPKNVMSLTGDGNTRLGRDNDSIVVDILDKIDKINDNFELMKNTLISLFNGIKYVDRKYVLEIYTKLWRGWVDSFMGLTPNGIPTGVLNSKIFRPQYNMAVYPPVIISLRGYAPDTERFRRPAGAGGIPYDLENFYEGFEGMYYLWSEFNNVWKKFLTLYNTTNRTSFKPPLF